MLEFTLEYQTTFEPFPGFWVLTTRISEVSKLFGILTWILPKIQEKSGKYMGP